MSLNAGRRSRTRSTLVMVILATIPCYCLGLILLDVGRVARQAGTPTAPPTSTAPARRTNTPRPSQTAIIFPSDTAMPSSTITWTPSPTYTPFVIPTHTATYTLIPSRTSGPPTATPENTHTPTPTATSTP